MTEQPYELYEPLVIPETEIATVINWIKAEQVRVINQDRTLGFNKVQKVDWLSETVENLKILQTRATDDNSRVSSENERRVRINARRAAEAARFAPCFCAPGCACKNAEDL